MEFPPGENSGETHRFILEDLTRVPGSPRKRALEQFAAARKFGKRRQGETFEWPDRPLRAGVELPQGFHGVAEQFKPHRPGRFRREDVHDAAAHCELTGHLDCLVPLVAHACQVRDQLFERDLFVPRYRAPQGAIKLGLT